MARAQHLVVCVDNEGYEASLTTGKLYVAFSDSTTEKHDLVRVVDESGEDYLIRGRSSEKSTDPQAINP